jgi:uncharacterized damage-inducible protein DinB
MDQSSQEIIEAAKGEFLRAKNRVVNALNTTPPDKRNWAPSKSARSVKDLVAHCASSIPFMIDFLNGVPFPFTNMVEMDDACLAQEREFESAEQAVELLEKNSDGYMEWLNALSLDQLNSVLNTPMGSFPMASAITFPADHLRGHAAQMEYIQTILGDREMHMG